MVSSLSSHAVWRSSNTPGQTGHDLTTTEAIHERSQEGSMSTSLPCLSVIDLGWLALLCQTRNHLGVDTMLQQERGA